MFAAPGQSKSDQRTIEQRLGQMRVQMGHGGCKRSDVVRQPVVGVFDPTVHVTNPVVSLVLKVQTIRMVDQPRSENKHKHALLSIGRLKPILNDTQAHVFGGINNLLFQKRIRYYFDNDSLSKYVLELIIQKSANLISSIGLIKTYSYRNYVLIKTIECKHVCYNFKIKRLFLACNLILPSRT